MDEQEIRNHFRLVDPVIFTALEEVTLKDWFHQPLTPEHYFSKLVDQIISQQLNTKVADIIGQRLLNMTNQDVFTPESILSLSDEELRAAGLSKSKASYLRNLAQLTIDRQIRFEIFASADEETIIAELVKVKGIGRWTAEMFLMFALAKPDIFSYGDYGLKSGLKKLYNLSQHPTIEEATKITEKWRPYRSFGSFALWQSLAKKG